MGTLQRLLAPTHKLPTAGLVAEYLFTDAVGSQVLADTTGNHNGQNGATTGVDGTDTTFDGTKAAFAGGQYIVAASILADMTSDFTLMVLFDGATVAAAQTIACLASASSTVDYQSLETSSAGGVVRFTTRGTSDGILSSGAIAYDTTKLCLATLIKSGSTIAIVNEATGATISGTSKTPAGVPRLGIGALTRSSISQFMTGNVYYLRLHTGALSHADRLAVLHYCRKLATARGKVSA